MINSNIKLLFFANFDYDYLKIRKKSTYSDFSINHF